MNWTFDYSEDANLVTVKIAGRFHAKDHGQNMRDLMSQDFWQPGINVLFDFRGVDFAETSLEDLRKGANRLADYSASLGYSKVAILMKSVADYGRGRQFEILTDEKTGADIRVFLDERQAVNWLTI